MRALFILRYAATAIMAGLAAASQYWPHQPWVGIGIAVAGTLAVHVVPSSIQSADAVARIGQGKP